MFRRELDRPSERQVTESERHVRDPADRDKGPTVDPTAATERDGAVTAARVTATYADGRAITWENGRVSGDRRLIASLATVARLADYGSATAAPPRRLADYERDPQAFISLALLLDEDGARMELEGNVDWPESPPGG
jgi:hypothetical protein